MNKTLSAVGSALLLLTSSVALAEGGGTHHAPHVEWFKWSMDAPPVGWLIVDFAVFFFLLVRFGGGPLSAYLLNRHTAVKKAIEEAQAAKADAEKKAREFEARVNALDVEVTKIRDEFKKSGEALRDRILESGRRMGERIAADAKTTIAAEETRAHELLKQEAARLALQLAEKAVREKVGAPDHKRLNEDFVRELRS